MGFEDLSEHFDPDLYLPIRGKTYRIHCESAHDGLRLRQVFAAAGAMTMAQEHAEAIKLLGATWVSHSEAVPVFDDTTDYQLLDADGERVTRDITVGEWTGGVYQEMADDGVTIEEIMHAGLTALHKAVFGRKQAEEYWRTRHPGTQTGEDGEVTPGKAPASQATKAPPKKRTSPKKTQTGRSSSRASTTTRKAPTTGGRGRTAKTTQAAGTTTR